MHEPESLDPDAVDDMLRAVHSGGRLNVPAIGEIDFSASTDLIFDYGEELPRAYQRYAIYCP